MLHSPLFSVWTGNYTACVGWLPVMAGSEVGVEKVTISGRPLQATTIHERLHELLTIVSPPRLFASVTPDKIIQLMTLDGSGGPTLGVDQVIATFYEVPGFPRLESEAVIRRGIVRGVRERAFGFVGRIGTDEIRRVREQAGYLADARLVRIGVELPEDEIDPAAAFIVMPAAIAGPASTPPPTPVPGGGPQPSVVTPASGTGGITTEGVPAPPGGAGVSRPTTIRLSLRMARQQLYASFNAIGNLAEKAGTVRMMVEAEKTDGFDPAWLRNAVLEPLQEADVLEE